MRVKTQTLEAVRRSLYETPMDTADLPTTTRPAAAVPDRLVRAAHPVAMRGEDLYARARNFMVDGQVRPNRVYASLLLAAMRLVPRHRFVPAHMLSRAYTDEGVPLTAERGVAGRVLTEPMVIAQLIELAGVRPGERALLVGANTGYAAVLLDACRANVTALEQDPDLLAVARPLLAELAPRVTLVEGPLADGWPALAPYDLIIIDGSVEAIPPAIAGQLRPAAPQFGGRLITVIHGDAVGRAVIAELADGRIGIAQHFDCNVGLLGPLAPPPSFAF